MDTSKSIGSAICQTGLYDLSVSESLARLLPGGGLFVDVGANVGYMSLLGGLVVGKSGRMLSFEPNPALRDILKENLRQLDRNRNVAVEVFDSALGEKRGRAELIVPGDYSGNDGVAFIGKGLWAENGDQVYEVGIERLDDIIPETSVDVMKVDVEGHELSVLKGASSLLEHKRIRHIIFEEHKGPDSPVCSYLSKLGYTLYSLGWRTFGPACMTIEKGELRRDFEPNNYLATIDSESVVQAMRPRGWRVIGKL